MDGPQAEQLELGPCGQILQDEDKSKREEKLSPAQIRKRPRVSHSQGQRELSDYTWTESLLGGQKGGGHHPIVSDTNYL